MKNKSSTDKTVGKKKVLGQEQEDRLTGKFKLAVREAVEDWGDIAQQAKVCRRLQGTMDTTSTNIRAVKHNVGDLQKELLNLCHEVTEMDGGQITEV